MNPNGNKLNIVVRKKKTDNKTTGVRELSFDFVSSKLPPNRNWFWCIRELRAFDDRFHGEIALLSRRTSVDSRVRLFRHLPYRPKT